MTHLTSSSSSRVFIHSFICSFVRSFIHSVNPFVCLVQATSGAWSSARMEHGVPTLVGCIGHGWRPQGRTPVLAKRMGQI